MFKYIVTTDFSIWPFQCKGEYAALPIIYFVDSYMAARRMVREFTNDWMVQPTLQTKVLPLFVIERLKQQDRIGNNIPITKFKGIREDGTEIWFAISLVKF